MKFRGSVDVRIQALLRHLAGGCTQAVAWSAQGPMVVGQYVIHHCVMRHYVICRRAVRPADAKGPLRGKLRPFPLPFS